MVVRASARRRKDNAETLRALRFAEKAKRKSEEKSEEKDLTQRSRRTEHRDHREERTEDRKWHSEKIMRRCHCFTQHTEALRFGEKT
jgi:hypothetical protein